MDWKEYAKAITAAVIAGLTALGTALVDDQSVSWSELVAVLIAFLVALGAVWRIPNQPPAATRK